MIEIVCDLENAIHSSFSTILFFSFMILLFYCQCCCQCGFGRRVQHSTVSGNQRPTTTLFLIDHRRHHQQYGIFEFWMVIDWEERQMIKQVNRGTKKSLTVVVSFADSTFITIIAIIIVILAMRSPRCSKGLYYCSAKKRFRQQQQQ